MRAEKGVDLRKMLAANGAIHFSLVQKGVWDCAFQDIFFKFTKFMSLLSKTVDSL